MGSTNVDGTPPVGSRVGTWTETRFDLQVPGLSCVLVFAFNQPFPAGTRLQVFEQLVDSPWLEMELTPVEGNPALGYAVVTHQFLVNPPAWEIVFKEVVRSPEGAELLRGELRMFKAAPNPCWNGTLPDPVTLQCPSTDGDWNYKDFENFNPNADIFTSGDQDLPED